MTQRQARPSPMAVTDYRKVPAYARQVLAPLFAVDQKTWMAASATTFQPLGLVIWGASDDTFVTDIRIGNQGQVYGMHAEGKIPARLFDNRRSFEELAELAKSGELGGAFLDREFFPMSVAESGNTMRVHIEGPAPKAMALFGNIYDQPWDGPVRSVVITPASDGKSYDGQVFDKTLLGDQLVFEVNAPNLESATCIVATRLAPRRASYA